MPLRTPRIAGSSSAVALTASLAVAAAVAVVAVRPAATTAADVAAGPSTVAAENAARLASPDFVLKSAAVRHVKELGLLVFEQTVAGQAGNTRPVPAGNHDAAPVFAYVFRTDLKPQDIGYGPTDGLVALAVTSHPDFDDSPVWDENGDGDRANDGATYHSHWVVLHEDKRAPGGLAVKEFEGAKPTVPGTAPGLPLYLDSPGYTIVRDGSTVRVLVPVDRVNGRSDLRYDAITAYLEHSMTPGKPLLGVHKVVSGVTKERPLGYAVER